MTILAFDGKTVACDTHGVYNDCMIVEFTKIKIVERYADEKIVAVSGCGNLADLDKFLLWLESSDDPQLYPYLGEECESTFVVFDDENVSQYWASSRGVPHVTPLQDECNKICWGSGMMTGIGVLRNGGSSIDAVKAACRSVAGCGGDIQTVTIPEFEQKVIKQLPMKWEDED